MRSSKSPLGNRRCFPPSGRGKVPTQAQWLAMESLASLNLWGSGGTAGHVTASLGMSPTRYVEAGEPIRPGATKIAETSGWILHATPRVPTSNSMNPSVIFSTRPNHVRRPFVNSRAKAIQSSGVASWQPTTWNTTLNSIVQHFDVSLLSPEFSGWTSRSTVGQPAYGTPCSREWINSRPRSTTRHELQHLDLIADCYTSRFEYKGIRAKAREYARSRDVYSVVPSHRAKDAPIGT